MEYTNNETNPDNSRDWLVGALLFATALGIMIPKDHGIVVDLKGELAQLHPFKRVIIHNDGLQIAIINPTGDELDNLKEGDVVHTLKQENYDENKEEIDKIIKKDLVY